MTGIAGCGKVPSVLLHFIISSPSTNGLGPKMGREVQNWGEWQTCCKARGPAFSSLPMVTKETRCGIGHQESNGRIGRILIHIHSRTTSTRRAFTKTLSKRTISVAGATDTRNLAIGQMLGGSLARVQRTRPLERSGTFLDSGMSKLEDGSQFLHSSGGFEDFVRRDYWRQPS